MMRFYFLKIPVRIVSFACPTELTLFDLELYFCASVFLPFQFYQNGCALFIKILVVFKMEIDCLKIKRDID